MREKKLELPLKQGVSCRAVQCNISNKRIRAKNSTAAFLGTEPCQAGVRSWVPFLPRQTLMDIWGGRHRVSMLAFRWGTQWKKPNEGIAVICSVFDTENYDLLVERFAFSVSNCWGNFRKIQLTLKIFAECFFPTAWVWFLEPQRIRKEGGAPEQRDLGPSAHPLSGSCQDTMLNEHGAACAAINTFLDNM